MGNDYTTFEPHKRPRPMKRAHRVISPTILAAAVLTVLAAACGTDQTAVTDPQTLPVDSISATYILTSVNDKPLPAELYAFSYLDESTGFLRDVHVVATEGYVHLRDDGTYEQRVNMQTLVDGQLSGFPVYFDRGAWRAIENSDLVSFESFYIEAVGVFHGIAHDRKVLLSQNLSGEARLPDAGFTYTRQ